MRRVSALAARTVLSSTAAATSSCPSSSAARGTFRTISRAFHASSVLKKTPQPPAFSSSPSRMARGSPGGGNGGRRRGGKGSSVSGRVRGGSTPLSRDRISMSRQRMPLSRSRMPLGIAGISPRAAGGAGLTQYNLEVPFAILDSRNGVWADILSEVSSTHGVEIGRHRNQFSRTLLTIHAASQESFEQAANAIKVARERRVHQATVPIPDKQAKLRIVGHNGVRMASVGKKHGVSIRYCEAESCAYIQGASKQDVKRAKSQLDADEHRVDIGRDGQMQMLMAQDAIMLKAMENKWKVKISPPEVNMRGMGGAVNLRPSRSTNTSSVNNISIVGKEDEVEGAVAEIATLMDHSAPIDLSPWYKRKIVTVPHGRREAVIGDRGAGLAKMVDSVYGVISRRASPVPPRGAPQNQPIDVSVGGPPEAVDNALSAIRRAIGSNVEVPFAQAARLISKDLNPAIRAMAERHQVSIMRPSFAYFQSETRRCLMESVAPPPMQFRVSFGDVKTHAAAIEDLKALAKSDDWSFSRIDVPRWHIGRVVGDRFDNVQKAMDEHGVSISIQRDTSRSDTMLLDVEGPKSGVEAALGAMQALITPPNWTEKRTISIPSRRMASLGGQQFVRLTAVKENLDVALYVKSPENANQSQHEVVIEGTPEGVKEACVRIEEMVGVERLVMLPQNPKNGVTEYAGLSSKDYSRKEFRQMIVSSMRSFMQRWGTTIDFQDISSPEKGLSVLGASEESVNGTIEDIHANVHGTTHTVSIPPHAQFRVLGKNSQNVGRMKSNYGVAVELRDSASESEDHASGGSGSSSVSISKSNNINSNKHLDMIIKGTESGVSQAVEQIEQKIGIEEIIEVPAPYAGVIVGKHQHILQQIQKLSGAVVLRVPMGSKRTASAKHRFIVRAIDREQADMAIDMMRAIVERHRNMPREEIRIPESLWGLFIGSKGENIRSLEMKYDVKVVSPKDSGQSLHGMSFEQRMAVRKQKNKARELNRKGAGTDSTVKAEDPSTKNTFIVRGDKRENVQAAINAIRRFLRAPWAFAKFSDDRVIAEVPIPFEVQGKVIGQGGENVRRLNAHFNVEVRAPPYSSGQALCVFKGESEDAIHNALVALGRLIGYTFQKKDDKIEGGSLAYDVAQVPGTSQRRKFTSRFRRKQDKSRGPRLSQREQAKLKKEQTLQYLKGKKIPLVGGESLSILAKKMRAPLPMIKSACLNLGFSQSEIADSHAQLEAEQAELIVIELGAEPVVNTELAGIRRSKRKLDEGEGESRSPVVVVMGHVDHGKTTLLDCLRGDMVQNVADGEAGGITQATTAFTVGGAIEAGRTKGKKSKKKKGSKKAAAPKKQKGGSVNMGIDSKILPSVTFIDTPGHAAFTVMRESGINSTDILVLVVAADDGVMAQTIESATAAKEMGLPIVVAVTKCDIDGIDAEEAQERIEHELAVHSIQSERLGGDVQVVQVSGATGQGKDELVETLALQAEIMGLRADPKGRGEAIVLEGTYVKGKGPVADIIVQWGTLKTRDFVVVGGAYGRVKSMEDPATGASLKIAGPSQPVRVVGLVGTPRSGDDMIVVGSMEEAREAAEANIERDKWSDLILDQNQTDERRDQRDEEYAVERRAKGPWWLKRRGSQLPGSVDASEGEEEEDVEDSKPPERNIFLVAQSDGGMKAVESCVAAIEKEFSVSYPVLRAVVGDMSTADVEEAAASEALVLTYNTKLQRPVENEVKRQGVDLQEFKLIYELEDKLRETAVEMQPEQLEERRVGKADVLEIFHLRGKNAGSAIGLRVKSGELGAKSLYRVVRNEEVVAEALTADSLRIHQDDVQTVPSGSDCGLILVDENGVGFVAEEFDVIECYTLEAKQKSENDQGEGQIAAAD